MADDPWAAFAGTPGADQAVAPSSVAPDDRWAAFAGTPPAAPAREVGSFGSVEPRYVQQGEPGYAPDRMTNLSPEDWAKFQAGATPAPQPDRPAGVTGRAANVAAGGNDALAGAAGLPVDLMAGALNLIPRGINAVAGTNIPLITDPVGGSASIRKAMGLIGANPDDVVQEDGLDRILRAAGAGAVSAALPTGAAALAARAGLAAPAAVDAALNVFGRATPINAAVGAASGVAGEQAGEFVPEPYKPLANVLGGVVAGGALGAAGVGVNKLMQFVEPRNIPSRMNTLYEAGTGAPIVDSDGKSVTATPGQVQVAGRQLEGMLADPAAARTALADAPRELVPGSPATTFQVTQDPVLGQYERGMARSGPEASAAFGARADQQNAAQVQAIRGIAPEGDPAVVVQQAQAADPAPAGVARVAAAQGQAGQALDAVPAAGLPAGAEDRVGAALRAPAAAADQAAGEAEKQIWRAVDPDGTMGVAMTPVTGKVQEVLRAESPNAAPLKGEEDAIFTKAAGFPAVQSFKDLAAFRTRITDELRQQRGPTGNPQSVRRLSMLLDGVHDAMEGGVAGRAAEDAAAVRAGTMSPEQTMLTRINQWVDAQRAASGEATAFATGTGGSSGVGTSTGIGTSSDARASGAAGQAGGRLGNPSSNSGVQGQEPLTPTWDDAARARYDAARAVSADRRATFRDAPGVGDLLASGPTSGSFRTPDYAAPGTVFSPGLGGHDKVHAYLAAGGAEDALNTTAAFMLRREAMRPDGTLDPARYQAWAKRYASALSAMPEMRGRFNTASQAQRAVEDMVSQHAQDTRAFQASLVGKLAGGNVDPVALVGSALRSPTTARSDMAMLGRMVADNPDAQAGLQRAIADHILATMKGDQLGVGAGETRLYGATLQKFIRTASPALREVMTDNQVRTLQAVADDVQRANLSVSGTRLPGGSDTVQNANAAGAPTMLRSLMQETGKAVSSGPGMVMAGAGGYAAYGPLGAAMGATLGSGPIVARAVANARAAGMATVNDLVREAMLNPALAQVLLARVTPGNQVRMQQSMAAVLGRMAGMPDTRSTPAERRRQTLPGPPMNALAGLGGAGPVRMNDLMGVGRKGE